jgi:hypothetical protein
VEGLGVAFKVGDLNDCLELLVDAGRLDGAVDIVYGLLRDDLIVWSSGVPNKANL